MDTSRISTLGMNPAQRRALYLLLRKRGVDVFAHLPIVRVSREQPLPLSAAQRRLWLFWKLNPTSAAYHITGALRLRGELDVAVLRSALTRLVERHEALRTTFVEVDGEPLQQVVAPGPASLSVRDIPAEPTARELTALITELASEPFNLSQGPLMRCALLRSDERRAVFVVTLHHIAADAWSLDVIMRELMQLYAAQRSGARIALPELSIQYLDYAQWHETWLSAGESARQLGYFKEQLANAEPGPLPLPCDFPRPPVQSYRGGAVRGRIPAPLAAELTRLARFEGVSLYVLMLTLYGAWLSRWTGRKQLVIGAPIANRARAETLGIVGFFVNTQALQLEIDTRQSFLDCVRAVKQVAAGAQAHRELPFDRLVDALKPERSLAHHPLFQVMFNHLSDSQDGADKAASAAGLSLEPLVTPTTTTQFDLTLDTQLDAEQQIRLNLEYASDLFEGKSAERMLADYIKLAHAVAQEPSRPLRALAIDVPAVLETPLCADPEPLPLLIARRCEERGDAVALRCGAEQLSFAALEQRVQSLAAHLYAHGALAEQVVGVLCDRSLDALVAMLAVLRAGAVLLPLDRSYPAARVAEMLELSSSRYLLTAAAADVPQTLQVEHVLDWHAHETAPLPAAAVPEAAQLAYVLFTSGSTGRPKAVAVTHAALARQIAAVSMQYGLSKTDVFLQFSSLSFDASLEQWLAPLSVGAEVVMRPDELWTPLQLMAAIERHGITRLDLPPSYAGELASALTTRPASLRSCTVGGEALPRETLLLLRERLAGAELFNAYGPTEAVITPLCWRIQGQPRAAYAPIGAPLAGRRALVLDADLNATPKGASGELYIAGDTLARGYLSRPRETAERFLPDPTTPGARMYRTGDLVRVGSDGALEFQGRSDGQVKLRGHRVELGEIESRLLAQPGVREAAAIIRAGAGGSPQLLAYAAGDALSSQSLLDALARSLPGYMLPAHVLVLPAFPRLPNGKLDARELPEPDLPAMQLGAAPQGEREQLVAELFQAVLGLKEADRSASFFALGGDSILVLQLCSRARERGFELSAREVFEHQSVRELARVLRALDVAKPAELAPLLANAEVALTPIQLDFFATPMPARHHYNQSVLLASQEPLDAQRLSYALEQLVARHDALRLRFMQQADAWEQRVAADSGSVLREGEAADAAALTALCEATQRSLDLAHGPLFAALHVRMPDESSRLLLCAHHLVVDGVSFRILLAELSSLYAHGQLAPLPAATTSFARWSERLQAFSQSTQLDVARGLFQRTLLEPAATLRAPKPGTAYSPHGRAGRALTSLDRAATERLLRGAPKAYRTQGAELLLTALARVLSDFTGESAVSVELESHGRDAPFSGVDLSGSVGWFTALYPVRLTAANDWGEAVKANKESLRMLTQHAVAYSVLRECRAELREWPRPGLTFNYLGQFDDALSRGALHVAAESRGPDLAEDSPLQNGLEINGQVFDGELSLVWSFDPALYTSAEVNALAAQYETALRALIAHCDVGECLGLTPSDVPLAGLGQTELDALPIRAAQIEDVYPLTPLQQGMLFHELDAPERGTYVNQLDVNVKGLVPERLSVAWQRTLECHAILRTAFVWEDVPHPVQIVVRSARANVELRDLRALAAQEVEAALRELSRAEHARGLPLAHAPLARFVIASLPDGSHQLIWTTHHLLLDGWSNARLLAELIAAYEAPHAAALPAPPFKRYLQWLAERSQAEAERFWRAELAQVPAVTYLANAAPPCVRNPGRGIVRKVVAADVLSQLCELARAERVTLGCVLEAAFGMLLSAYTGQPSVMYGVTVSGRPASLPGAEHMLGLFINTIPSVQRIQLGASIGEHLRELQRGAAERREHEHTPLNLLARWAGQPGRPLFDCLLVFENYPVSQALASAETGSLCFGPTRGVESTDFPLALSINQGEELSLTFDYARDAFDERTASELRDRFVHVLQRLCSDHVKRVADVSVLRPEDEARLDALRRVVQAERERGFVHTWIAERAAVQPDAVAVVCGSERLTFSQLVTRARALAQRLVELPLAPDDRVGIALPRSTDLLVAVLGVLEAGAAYVPLDPGYPAARLQLMAADAGLRALVSTRGLSARIDELSDCERVWIEDVPATRDARPLTAALQPEHLAYVIYTSGSTGKPKGVAVSHAALSMHLAAAARTYALGPRDAALHLASISFDAAVEQWAVPLMSGAKLVLHAEGEESPEVLHALCLREQVSLIYPPTSLILGLAQHQMGLPPGERRLQLRLCCVGGEAVSRDTLQRLGAAFQPERVINGYGPTETVITPLLWQAYADTPVESAYAPIGRPVGRRSAVILNAALEPVAPGLVGELYIAGEGLARGYFEAPRQTAERFLPAPLAAGERMYRTGDLVRLLPSGAVEFVGRADAQIKLRGFRIEPAEIEAALLGLPGVSEAVVTLEQAPHKRVVAHVAAGSAEAELRAQLKAALPAHLVPSRIVVLQRLPRTPNGKVDRAALPRPDAAAQGFEPPQGELECALARLWCELLSLPRVGRDDNFFELGGDSIVSIQLIGRARKVGLALTTRQVFEHPTLRALGRVVKPLSETAEVEARPEGDVPLTPIQHVFFQQPIAAPAHYNQALLLRPRAALDSVALAGALEHVLTHHDALRLCFEHGKQRYAEHSATAAEVLWRRRASGRAEIEALCQAAQRSLDLQRGPLVRALHIQVDDGSERLLLAVHHLVMDGVSFRILLEDVEGSYRALAAGEPAPELLRTSSFQRYAQQLVRFAEGAANEAVPAWEALLSGSSTRLPRDLPGKLQPLPPVRAHERVLLSHALTEQLLRETGHAYHTRVDDLLLCALARTLCAYTGASSIPVALESHGRQELFEGLDLTRTLGWFTALYPVRLSAAGEPGVALPAVKEQLRSVPHQGLSHGALLSLGPAAARERLRALPEPQVLFNYLGQLDQSFDMQQGLFVPASESSGDDTDPDAPPAYVFSVNAEIVAGQLRVEWGYCPGLHHAESVRGLASRYQQELRALIEHCRAQRRSTWTPSDVPLAVLDQAALSKLSEREPEAQDVYRLTPLQQGMLFHALSTPGADVYVTQLAVDLRGLDDAGVAQLRAAWQATLDAHESLRTCFLTRDLPHPVQLVEARAELPFELIETATDLAQLAELERLRGFDLEHAPLMRVTLARTGKDAYRMLWTSHHLLLDGWSSSLLLGEVLERFAGAQPAAPQQRFRDYVAWLAARDLGASERYFRAQLAHLSEPSLLGRPVHHAHDASYASVQQTLSTEVCERLEQLARASSGTLSSAVCAGWALVLSRALGQACVAFGSTVSGRPPELQDVERVLGLFINTVPVISTPRAGLRVRQWLQQTAAEQLELREHEHTPLYDIQGWAGFGGPLFDSLVVFENYPVARNLSERRGALSFEAMGTHETTSYALTIGVSRDATGLAIVFDYQREALDESLVKRLLAGFCSVLSQLAARPDALLGELGLWTEEAPQLSAASVPVTDCVASFWRQAALHPHTPALTDAQGTRTYAELAQLVNAAAQELRARGIGPERIVGVHAPRSADTVVALLSVLAAGGAFVLLDPALPEAALNRQCRLAGLSLILTATPGALSQLEGAPQLGLSALLDAASWREPASLSLPPTEALAYVLYTSGSTGMPKGVEVSRAALSRQLCAMGELNGITPGDRVLLFASLAFDAALEQWLLPFSRGASVLVMDGVWSVEETLQALEQRALTHVDLPPAYAVMLAHELERRRPTLQLKCMTVGGEAITARNHELVVRAIAPARLCNAYGPTEAVITPTAAMSGDDACVSETGYAPIGNPLASRRAYVLDACLAPLPRGVAGELYLAGEPLARSYRGWPAATAQRFVPDPFGTGGRMLRTGDRVRQLPDGTLEFLGRVDQQLKIRGFRVELGEVEAALLRHPSVREAAALARMHAGKLSLIAYAVCDGADADQLLQHLRGELAEHALPSVLVLVPSLPRTAQGKLDVRALPEARRAAQEPLSPRTAVEQLVAAGMCAVLGCAEISVHDNFFELGGDSLRALALVTELGRRGLRVQLSQVVRCPTVASLAARVDPADDTNVANAPHLMAEPSAVIALTGAAGPRSPLFCLHPAGGTPFVYLPLARALAPQRAVYGLLCRTLSDPAYRDDSIESMAADYARQILQVQPSGPYHLLGWSLGGAIALHVAHALEKQGAEVRTLFLADSFVPGLFEAAAEWAEPEPEPLESSAFSMPDRAAGRAALQHLTALSRSCRLPVLRVRPACVWSREERALHATAETLLEQGTRSQLHCLGEIPVSHMEIVSDPQLFAAVSAQLIAAEDAS